MLSISKLDVSSLGRYKSLEHLQSWVKKERKQVTINVSWETSGRSRRKNYCKGHVQINTQNAIFSPLIWYNHIRSAVDYLRHGIWPWLMQTQDCSGDTGFPYNKQIKVVLQWPIQNQLRVCLSWKTTKPIGENKYNLKMSNKRSRTHKFILSSIANSSIARNSIKCQLAAKHQSIRDYFFLKE
jgi:hypothetical protein